MRIVNLFDIFVNPCNDPGWQLWSGDKLIGVYNTRREARDARAAYLKHGEDVYWSGNGWHWP